jgi:hypothetical protein
MKKDLLLPVDRKLFHLPLARILAQTIMTKEAHLLGFKSAKLRLEASQEPDNLENVVNPDHRKKRKKKKSKPTQTPTPQPKRRTQQRKTSITPALYTISSSTHTEDQHQQPRSTTTRPLQFPQHQNICAIQQLLVILFMMVKFKRERRTLKQLDMCYLFIGREIK